MRVTPSKLILPTDEVVARYVTWAGVEVTALRAELGVFRTALIYNYACWREGIAPYDIVRLVEKFDGRFAPGWSPERLLSGDDGHRVAVL